MIKHKRYLFYLQNQKKYILLQNRIQNNHMEKANNLQGYCWSNPCE